MSGQDAKTTSENGQILHGEDETGPSGFDRLKTGTKPTFGGAGSKPGAGLHIVATPIGNLGDITARALETLAGADLIACEDTRVTGKLLHRFGIKTPMTAYHEHNAQVVRPHVIARMEQGQAVALVSDAGTPLISDPGYRLVQDCHDKGIAVTPVPGASALLTALTIAGLPTDRFLFAGFLPNKDKARRDALADVADVPATLVFYESPKRLAACLTAMADVLGDRPAAVCRELTKLHEEVRRGVLADLAASYAETDAPKGEIVIVVGSPEIAPEVLTDADIDALLREALQSLRVKDAASAVAEKTGLHKRDLYARALALKNDT